MIIFVKMIIRLSKDDYKTNKTSVLREYKDVRSEELRKRL
jgi:hypothetical protein